MSDDGTAGPGSCHALSMLLWRSVIVAILVYEERGFL